MEPLVDMMLESSEARTVNVVRKISVMSEKDRYVAFLSWINLELTGLHGVMYAILRLKTHTSHANKYSGSTVQHEYTCQAVAERESARD